MDYPTSNWSILLSATLGPDSVPPPTLIIPMFPITSTFLASSSALPIAPFLSSVRLPTHLIELLLSVQAQS